MGRHKKNNKHLPQKMRLKHGAYYYVARNNRQVWTLLSRDLREAPIKWATIDGLDKSGETVEHAVDRFLAEIVPLKTEATRRDYLRYATKVKVYFVSSVHQSNSLGLVLVQSMLRSTA